MNKRVVHNQLSWTAYYNDMCWTHQSKKDEVRWYLQKSCKKCENYNTTKWSESRSEVKKLAILKKEKIEKINTHKTQIEDYSDSIWTVLNLNVNQENIDNWKIDMKFKNQYEHLDNQYRALCKCLLEEW